jgi:ABC-type transport system involved in multi-copper enzyme maturation permease subunit
VISWPIARATFLERGRAPAAIILVALVVLAGLARTNGGSYGAEAFSGPPGSFFLLLLVLVLGAGLLADEVESGHVQLVLLRPLTRAQWVSGRLAGAGGIVCAAVLGGAVASAGAAIFRGSFGEPLGRLAVVLLALSAALAWLAVLTAVSAVLNGWTNVGAVVLAKLLWGFASVALPLAFGSPSLQATLHAIDPFVGPQDALALARQLVLHEPVQWSLFLYDLVWLFGCWLLAVLLFNRRELARRRA